MMRILFVGCLSVLLCGPVHGQTFSIEISVEWKRTDTRLNAGSIKPGQIVSPFLKVTYRNMTGEDIYIARVTDNDYPGGITGLMNTQKDLAMRVKDHSDYSDEVFIVEIGDVWDVMEPDVASLKVRETAAINDELWNIYTVVKTQQQLNELGSQKQLACFGYPNREVLSYREAQALIGVRGYDRGFLNVDTTALSASEVLELYSNQFIFLKEGETFEQSIDLIGFYMLGGEYTFRLGNEQVPASVIGKGGQNVNLPGYINGYRLYRGRFLSNSVGIKMRR